MKIFCVFGRHNYGDPLRGEGYEYSNFIPALRCLGHEVHHFESWNRAAHRSFGDLNLSLIESVRGIQPDLVFCVLMTYEVWIETLDLIRTSGVPVVNWGTDDSWRFEQFSRHVAPHVDVWATTDHAAFAKAQCLGQGNFELTQWAASSARTAEPLRAADCEYDVSFVGSSYGNRVEWVEALRREGIVVECFGHGWSRGAVEASEIPNIYRRSRITLNFGDSSLHWQGLRAHRVRQIKARVFEVPAAGGCLLTENAPHLESYYDLEREVMTFSDLNDLVSRVRHLLAHPADRDALAWAGYRRTIAEHLYEKRFPPLLRRALLTGRQTSNSSVDMSSLISKHRTGPFLRALREILLVMFKAIWGPTRGPRAARRAVYELHTRLFGPRAYRARGIPGRLFYLEG